MEEGRVIYVVVLEERHIGWRVEAFRDLDEANERARELAREYAWEESEIEDLTEDGFVTMKFSEEGGYASVVGTEVR